MRAVLPLLCVGCSFSVAPSGRTPSPPDEIAYVAVATLDSDGVWIEGSPLEARGASRPFTGEIVEQADGVETRLIGFTEPQISGCAAALQPPPGNVQPAHYPFARLPPPAWLVSGRWAEGRVDLEPSDAELPLSTTGIEEPVAPCTVFDADVQDSGIEVADRIRFMVPLDDRRLLFGTRKSTAQVLDVETLEITTVGTSSSARYLSAFVDDDGVAWMFEDSGRLEKMVPGGTPELVSDGHPWAGSDYGSSGGGGTGDSLELFVFYSTGGAAYFDGQGWEVVYETQPESQRQFSSVIWNGRGDVYFVFDGRHELFHFQDGHIYTEMVTMLEQGSLVVALQSDRYGLLVGTRTGQMFRRLGRASWEELAGVTSGFRMEAMYELDRGVLFGAERLRSYVGELGTCDDGALLGETKMRGRIGRRILGSKEIDDRVTLVTIDVRPRRFGCD